MKRSGIVMGLTAALIAGAIGSRAYARESKSAKPAVIFASPDNATFTEVIPGVSKAPLWGNDHKGPYGAFTKFAPGFDAGMHTHSNDLWIVVLKGAYVYKDEAGEKRVEAGDFIRIPRRHKHWSGADPKDGALFYEEGNGKFDLVPVK